MKLIVCILIFAFSATLVEARERVDRRQTRQAARIHEGIKNGELTEGEAARLRRQQKRIRRAERRAKRNESVSAKEKAHLENMQDRASKNIYDKKHNDKNEASSNESAPE